MVENNEQYLIMTRIEIMSNESQAPSQASYFLQESHQQKLAKYEKRIKAKDNGR